MYKTFQEPKPNIFQFNPSIKLAQMAIVTAGERAASRPMPAFELLRPIRQSNKMDTDFLCTFFSLQPSGLCHAAAMMVMAFHLRSVRHRHGLKTWWWCRFMNSIRVSQSHESVWTSTCQQSKCLAPFYTYIICVAQYRKSSLPSNKRGRSNSGDIVGRWRRHPPVDEGGSFFYPHCSRKYKNQNYTPRNLALTMRAIIWRRAGNLLNTLWTEKKKCCWMAEWQLVDMEKEYETEKFMLLVRRRYDGTRLYLKNLKKLYV